MSLLDFFWGRKKEWPEKEKPIMPLGKGRHPIDDSLDYFQYTGMRTAADPREYDATKHIPYLSVGEFKGVFVEFRYTEEHGLQQFNNGVMVGACGTPFDPEKHAPIQSFSIVKKRKKRFWQRFSS